MNTNNDEIKSYFNEDVRKQIREMSTQDMNDHLKAFKDTPLWFAVLKYNQERIAVVQDSLISLDPIIEAVRIARYQGSIPGMLDLQDVVLRLNLKAKKAEDPKNKEEQNKNELGGAYGVGAN